MSDCTVQRMEDNPKRDEANSGQLEEAEVSCSPELGDLAHDTASSRKGWGSAAQCVEH
jgi:hypothetical protein